MYGINDCGKLKAGYKADDYIASSQVTYREGEPTGAMGGEMVRDPQGA